MKLMLREIRLLKGKKQDEVAAYLKITRAAYSNIENNKRDPDSNTLFLLANYYDVPMDDLFGRTYSDSKIDGSKYRLTELRERLHLKPQDIAKKLGITLTKYMKYELGDLSPTTDILVSLADFYHVTVDYLIGYSPIEQPRSVNPELTETELQLTKDYRSLNKQGKEYILQTMVMASTIYKNDSISELANHA